MRWGALALLVPALAGGTVPAMHELEEASVALVVRPDGLVSLRLQVPWATVLRAAGDRRLDAVAFLTEAVARPPGAFARDVARVTAQVERELRLVEGPMPRAFTRWRWPSAAEVQGALREELMSRLAEGPAFRHASRLPASAELQAGRAAAGARLVVPALLGPVLLTVSHPHEELLAPGGTSAAFRLRDR